MKKFILNLLTVLAWIYQIICVIGIIMWIVMGGVILFGIKNPRETEMLVLVFRGFFFIEILLVNFGGKFPNSH